MAMSGRIEAASKEGTSSNGGAALREDEVTKPMETALKET